MRPIHQAIPSTHSSRNGDGQMKQPRYRCQQTERSHSRSHIVDSKVSFAGPLTVELRTESNIAHDVETEEKELLGHLDDLAELLFHCSLQLLDMTHYAVFVGGER